MVVETRINLVLVHLNRKITNLIINSTCNSFSKRKQWLDDLRKSEIYYVPKNCEKNEQALISPRWSIDPVSQKKSEQNERKNAHFTPCKIDRWLPSAVSVSIFLSSGRCPESWIREEQDKKSSGSYLENWIWEGQDKTRQTEQLSGFCQEIFQFLKFIHTYLNFLVGGGSPGEEFTMSKFSQ